MKDGITNSHPIADVVFYNGEVITIDKNNTITEAIAIKDNQISFVGSTKKVKALIGKETKVIDLKGRSLLPGFIDSHIHLSIYGGNILDVNCNSQIKSLKDLFAKLKKEASQTKKGQWIRAWGFDEKNMCEQRFPTKRELDEITSDHPILIVRVCNHMSIVNSQALHLANINKNTQSPEGGIIDRDINGNLTGKLIEAAHMKLSEIASHSEDELKKALKLASDTFIKYGITSIHDAGGYGDGPEILKVMQKGIQSKEIKIRIYAMIASLTDAEKFIRKMKKQKVTTGSGNERFKIGPAKLFLDGSSTGPTIATRQPYTSDLNNHGILYYSQEKINSILVDAHKKGYQITAHAQGDQAIELILNCIETALLEDPTSDHRHRIEHAGIASPDLQKRMKELKVLAIPNPAFIYENGDSYVEFYGERVQWMYPVNDYKNLSIPMAFGSDAPIVDCDPLLGIHAAVNRKTKHDSLVGSEQKINILEAIKSYTIMGAYASFEEDIKGSLEENKLADLVVLNDSILSTSLEKIKDLQVDMTMIDGEMVYKNNLVADY